MHVEKWHLYAVSLCMCVCDGGHSPGQALNWNGLQGYMLLGKVHWLSWSWTHNAERPIGPDDNKWGASESVVLRSSESLTLSMPSAIMSFIYLKSGFYYFRELQILKWPDISSFSEIIWNALYVRKLFCHDVFGKIFQSNKCDWLVMTLRKRNYASKSQNSSSKHGFVYKECVF